jgi:FAD binding domain
MTDLEFDCVVVGSGNAGSSAALSAIDSGCKNVLLIDSCPPDWVGGNGYFTYDKWSLSHVLLTRLFLLFSAGAYRTVHAGLYDLLSVVGNVLPEQVSKIDMEPYTSQQFTDDIMRLGNGRSDPDLVNAVVENSRDAIAWLANRVHIPFIFSFHRQAYEVDGRQKFWGGMVLSVEDGGKGVIESYRRALQEAGVNVWFSTKAVELVKTNEAVSHLVVLKDGQMVTLKTPAVILAAGGFESSSQMRAKHLGPGWERAKVGIHTWHDYIDLHSSSIPGPWNAIQYGRRIPNGSACWGQSSRRLGRLS